MTCRCFRSLPKTVVAALSIACFLCIAWGSVTSALAANTWETWPRKKPPIGVAPQPPEPGEVAPQPPEPGEVAPQTPEPVEVAPQTSEPVEVAPRTPESVEVAPRTPEPVEAAPRTPEVVEAAPRTPVTGATAKSGASDLTLSSNTYALYYERELPGGEKNRYAPLYEYLSTDASNIGGKPVSLHFYGWGRVDLADETGSNRTAGEIGSLYLEYRHPNGNTLLKLGRFFMAEGAAVGILDGVFAKTTTPVGLGLSVHGGVPVEHSIADNVDGGSSVYGGRLFFVKSGFVEIGASYLKEDGDFQGTDLELYGGDLWLRVTKGMELTGQAAYNQSVKEMASQRYAVRIVPGSTFDISAGYESYTYKGLFPAALNPAFLAPAVNPNDKVASLFGVLDWEFVRGWTLELSGKSLNHKEADPGNAVRGGIGLRYAYNDKKDVAGLSAAFVSADLPENEYREYRGFASFSPGKLRLTLDALTQQYKQAINGTKDQVQVVATAGYRVLASLHLSGNLTYTDLPDFREDLAGLIRVNLDFGTGSGGKK